MDDVAAAGQAARLLAEPLRLRIIALLESGPATVSELTARIGAPQPRISAHLATLREAGWVRLSVSGQQHWYRLASPTIATALHTLASLARKPTTRERPGQSGSRASAASTLREGRTCYGHLAGKAGVLLCDLLHTKGWTVPVENKVGKYQPAFALTEVGRAELLARGVTIPTVTTRRQLAYACPDWIEPRPHLGGALGEAILQRLEQVHLVRRLPDSRAVEIKGDFTRWLE
jgi:DNA-binding transcriptional ArsR family regulator